NLQVAELTSGVWGKPVKIKATLYSAPSCAEVVAGQVLCVARNSSGRLAWSLYNGSTWSAFANLTTAAYSAPSCTTDNNSGVICAVYTTGYATVVNRFTAGAWEGFLNIGGIAAGEPDCTSMNSSGNVVCFALSYTSGIYGSRFNGGAWTVGDWTGYGGIGGVVNTNAGCTTQAAGQLVCGAYGVSTDDDAFYANVYNGSSWSGFILVGGTGVGTPACAPLGTGQAVCLVMGPDNKLTSTVGP
ncbi:MAG: hypothetical protein WAK62_11780, partial [Terriglobales bacterium]